jgi:hypothetical protein
MSKPGLPSIDEELAPKPRVNLKNLRAREPIADEDIAANASAIGEKWGASTQIGPTEPPVPLSPLISIRGYIPHYLDNELAMKAAGRRVTKTFLILEALQKAGYRVDENDMVEDRRKSKLRKGQ